MIPSIVKDFSIRVMAIPQLLPISDSRPKIPLLELRVAAPLNDIKSSRNWQHNTYAGAE